VAADAIQRIAAAGISGQPVAKIKNNSAERGHEQPSLTLHVAGHEIILHCDEQPRVFTLRPDP